MKRFIIIMMLVLFMAVSVSAVRLYEGGLTEVIDKDDAEVAAGEYSDSVGIALHAQTSGEITQITLTALELGTGDVLTPAGTVYILDVDPEASAGDAALAAAGAEHKTVIGTVTVDSTDWATADANGAVATVYCSVLFHKLSTLYFAFQPAAGETAINSAAGDDEELFLNFWYISY